MKKDISLQKKYTVVYTTKIHSIELKFAKKNGTCRQPILFKTEKPPVPTF